MEPPDEILLERALADEDAFATFYRRYERPVAAFFVLRDLTYFLSQLRSGG